LHTESNNQDVCKYFVTTNVLSFWLIPDLFCVSNQYEINSISVCGCFDGAVVHKRCAGSDDVRFWSAILLSEVQPVAFWHD